MPTALREAPAVRAFAGLADLWKATHVTSGRTTSGRAASCEATQEQGRHTPVQNQAGREWAGLDAPIGGNGADLSDATRLDDDTNLDDDGAFLAAIRRDGGISALERGRVERAVRIPTTPRTGPEVPAGAAPPRAAPPDSFLWGIADVGVDMPRWAAPGQDELAEQLARGGIAIDASVDLHGLHRQAAVDRLVGAIADAKARGDAVLRVVHGRGLHSPGGQPALRDAVRDALVRPPLRPMVQAWSQALPADGGPGATLVLLSVRGLAGRRPRR